MSSSSNSGSRPASETSNNGDTKHLQRDSILREILEHIERYKERFSKVDYPELKQNVLEPVINYEFKAEVQIRGFLRAFRHTDVFHEALEKIGDRQLQQQINDFVHGASAGDVVKETGFQVLSHPSPKVKHHFSLLSEIKKLVLEGLHADHAIEKVFAMMGEKKSIKPLPVIYEDAANKEVMEVYSDVPFQNWGESVENTPRYTFVPSTVLGLQNLVRFASANNRKVRCGGYRHSWAPLFSQDQEIFVSLLSIEQVTAMPDPTSISPEPSPGPRAKELKTVELQEQSSNNKNKRLCRVGVAVTNEEFRRWAVKNNSWALPVDVILVEVTVGGVNAPICHGAGYRHKTISDYVRRVEYVDCNGQLQIVDDPELIKAAAGSFGLLGIVTHLTFELDAMTYAVMEPRKVDIGLAIPPLDKKDIPVALRQGWFHSPDATKKLEAARAEFEHNALTKYYSEWFWFTYQQKAWVNTWNNTTDPTGAKGYPDDKDIFLQWIQGWMGYILTSSPLFNAIPGHWQAQLLATMGLAVLPPTDGEDKTPKIIAPLTDALHFRRGVQNMRVRDTEFEIPLPPRADNPLVPDTSIIQRAWWDVIKLVYSYDRSEAPLRLTLELRITGGSDVLMAPQQGNTLGTASIEVLTVPDAVSDGEWREFMQRVADIWMAYAKHYGGAKINVRPHWAKEWDGLTLGGKDARQYLKEVAYREQIPKFRDALAKIGETQGWRLEDLKKRFSNELWDQLIFSK